MQMSTNSIPRVAVFAVFLAFALDGYSQTTPQDDAPSWVVYRSENGQLLPESAWAASAMREKALSAGYITLWLQLDEGRISSSPADANGYREMCVKILQPLVNRGVVWHSSQGPQSTGSVCLVRASADGVTSLMKEKRFSQIMGANPPFRR